MTVPWSHRRRGQTVDRLRPPDARYLPRTPRRVRGVPDPQTRVRALAGVAPALTPAPPRSRYSQRWPPPAVSEAASAGHRSHMLPPPGNAAKRRLGVGRAVQRGRDASWAAYRAANPLIPKRIAPTFPARG